MLFSGVELPPPPLRSEQRRSNPPAIRWELTVPADHPAFEGHFPGRPVLPGVVVLGWIAAAGERLLGGPFTDGYEFVNVKFSRVILPGAELALELVRETPAGEPAAAPGARLRARVSSTEGGVHVSAWLTVAGPAGPGPAPATAPAA